MVKYAGRLPFWKVKDITDIAMDCQQKEYDCIIFVEGKRGVGKSTLTWRICKKLKSAKFNPEKDIVFSRKDVIIALAKRKYGIIFADEMINVAFKRDFYEEDQKTLIKGLNMYRDNFNVYVGCIPNFMNLDPQLRDLCRIRISIQRRGFAIVHTQIESNYLQDKWDTKTNQRIETLWLSKRNSKPRYSRLTTARAYLTFKDLTPQDKELYRRIKNEKRSRIFGGGEIELYEEPERKTIYDRIAEKMKGGQITFSEIKTFAELYGLPYETLRTGISNHLKRQDLSYKEIIQSIKDKEKVREEALKKIPKWVI